MFTQRSKQCNGISEITTRVHSLKEMAAKGYLLFLAIIVNDCASHIDDVILGGPTTNVDHYIKMVERTKLGGNEFRFILPYAFAAEMAIDVVNGQQLILPTCWITSHWLDDFCNPDLAVQVMLRAWIDDHE